MSDTKKSSPLNGFTAGSKASSKVGSKAGCKQGRKGPRTPLSRPVRGRAALPRHWGTAFFVAVVLVLSVLSGLDLTPRVQVFMAGEVATRDVAADKDFLLEDMVSTQARRQEVAESQPPVFVLDPGAVTRLERRVREVLDLASPPEGEAAGGFDTEAVRWQIAESLNREISVKTFHLWQGEKVRDLIFTHVLPRLSTLLARGVVLDERVLEGRNAGILVYDPVTGQDTLVLDASDVVTLGAARDNLAAVLRQELKRPLRVRKAVMELVEPVLVPSLAFDAEATAARREAAVNAVEPVYIPIRKGEVIVRRGEAVTAEGQIKLMALFNDRNDYFDAVHAGGVFVLGMLFTAGMLLSPRRRHFEPMPARTALLVGTVILVFAAMAKLLSIAGVFPGRPLLAISEELYPYAFPAAGAVGCLALFLRLRECFLANTLLAFLISYLLSGGLSLFAFLFLSGMANAVLIKRAQTRPQVMGSVFGLMGVMLVAWAGVALVTPFSLPQALAGAALVVAGAFLSLVAVLGCGPILEILSPTTSRFRLMELMNLEQPLLQELMATVPGTYHHSFVVANMVEAGARAIDANGLLCKVAALYHDIGKLNNPEYFIENQARGKNRHDKLAPSMSSLILISHVKKGVEMATKARLGRDIVDIIEQHHGTSVIRFFYEKAREQAVDRKAVREEEYRYPGPRPQTREAAIVMLADAIEASSRALNEPTSSRLRGHIDSIVKFIFAEGQLDESELTFRDLHLLSEAFHRVLTGIFHQRIEYPELPSGKSGSDRSGSDRNGSDKNGSANNGSEKNGVGNRDAGADPTAKDHDFGNGRGAAKETGKANGSGGGNGASGKIAPEPGSATAPGAKAGGAR